MTILPKKQAPSREGSDGDSESDGEESSAARTSISWPPGSVEDRSHEAALPPFDPHDSRVDLTGRGKRRQRRHRRLSPSHSRAQRAEATGYNSSDEYETSARMLHVTDEMERSFEQTLREKRGFIIKKMRSDGACLFRAVADQVYGDQECHGQVRNLCMDYMMKNADFFSQYVTEDFTAYINRKRCDSCYGNYIEMQALSELYNRSIEVYQYSVEPINIFHTIYDSGNAPIRVSYHRNLHYNSVINPKEPSIGVGLGLAGYKPGFADQRQMETAFRLSEMSAIEETMLADKLSATDHEATTDAVEEFVARESYMQFLKDQEKRWARLQRHGDASSSLASHSDDHYSPPKRPSPPPSPPYPSLSLAAQQIRHDNLQQLSSDSLKRPGHSRSTTVRSAVERRKERRRAPSSRSSASSRSPSSSPPHPGSPAQLNLPVRETPSPPSPPTSRTQPPSSRGLPLPSSKPTSGTTNGDTDSAAELTSSSVSSGAAAPSPSSITRADAAVAAELAASDFLLASGNQMFANLPPSLLGLSDLDDVDVMATVLAASQQEYLDQLKSNAGKKS